MLDNYVLSCANFYCSHRIFYLLFQSQKNMKESEFVDKNKNKWFEYETLLGKSDADPEKLSEVFIQITDDLSYARTNYPNRSVRVYLNNLARKFHDLLGKRKRLILNTLRTFYTIEVPQLFYKARYEMLISAVIFIVSFIIGIYSSIADPEFPKLILGETYVSITDANINNDDPMAIYRSGKGIDGFTAILINNARIDILMLSLGVLFGVGALLVLVYNGIMVGVFQYYFYAHGGFEESLATIWMHGTIEITTIILIGGLALTAGKGWLFPRTYTRFQSFQISAGNAAKLTMAVLPFTFIAALIEGFLTRQTHSPLSFKIAVISLSLCVVIFYFIVYPIIIHRRHGINPNHNHLRVKSAVKPFSLLEIKSIAKVITDSLLIFKRVFVPIISVAFFASLLIISIIFFFFEEQVGLLKIDPVFFGIREFILNSWSNDVSIVNTDNTPFLTTLAVVSIVGTITAITWIILLKISKRSFGKSMKTDSRKYLIIPIGCLFLAAFFKMLPVKAGLAFNFSLLTNIMLTLSAFFMIRNIELGEKKLNFSFFFKNLQWIVVIWVILFFTRLFVQVLIGSPLITMLSSSIMELLPMSNEMVTHASVVFYTFGEVFLDFTFIGLEFITTIVLLYSLLERNFATELSQDLLSLHLLPINNDDLQ